MARAVGTVVSWVRNRGYGFLRVADQPRLVFCHVSAVQDGALDPPQVGDLVEFEPAETPRGPKAAAARVVKRAPVAAGRP